MADFLWVEKYRPKQISECILPDIKTTFSKLSKTRTDKSFTFIGHYEAQVKQPLLVLCVKN